MNKPNIGGNFLVDGSSFVTWFNNVFRTTNTRLYPYQVNEENFLKLMKYLPDLTGKKEITLGEFCGHFAIMYNETGGTFGILREYGTPQYLFNTTMPGGHTKHSYNKSPNHLAGEQLKSWGIISSEEDLQQWNGQVYPGQAPEEVKTAALSCDFYRFRGYGFNQLTWRTNFERCLQPHLPKPIDSYSNDEFEAAIQNYSIAAKTFHSFISGNEAAERAISDLVHGAFAAYGNLVSGNWAWYVQNQYVPRAKGLYDRLNSSFISNLTEENFETAGTSLTRAEIKIIQGNLFSSAAPENKILMQKHGGIDGYWGEVTQKVFLLSGKTIEELLHANYTEVENLTSQQVRVIQSSLINTGNADIKQAINKGGGINGKWNEETAKAVNDSGKTIEELLKT